MPQDGDGQETRLESPTSQPTTAPVETQPPQPVATGAAVEKEAAPDTSHPSEGGPKVADVPRDEAGRFASKDSKQSPPDPVAAAIDRLVKKTTPPEPDATTQPGKAAADAKPKDAKAPEAKPTDEALKNRTTDDLDAPPEERARWKRETAERFDRVLTAARTAREEVEKSAPLIEKGKEYSGILDGFDLHVDIGFVPPEHFAGVVKAQAAINRSLIAIEQGRLPAPADVETFKTLSANVDNLRAKLGIQSTAPVTPVIKPFEGELPADLKDMVDIYGFDETRARLLAALEAGAPAPAQPAAAKAPESIQPHTPSAKAVGVDMDQLYGRKFLSELAGEGVQRPSDHVGELLQSPLTKLEVIKRFPGVAMADVPAVFDSLDSQIRYDILKAAHKATMAKRVPARPPTPPPATPNRGIPTTTTPRRPATPASGDAVVDAIAYLSGT